MAAGAAGAALLPHAASREPATVRPGHARPPIEVADVE